LTRAGALATVAAMTICYFLTFHAPEHPDARVSDADKAAVTDIVKTTPGLARALVFTPEVTHDPYLHDGAPPLLALQLYFPDIATLEAALGRSGHLQALATRSFPSLAPARVTQQAMAGRVLPVPDPRFQTAPGERPCTYMVAYEGEAEDRIGWLTHYVASHGPIMARFPGIRQIEIFTRIDWLGALPWPRVDYMQRNKVVFDSPAALRAALSSPVRHEMRADFKAFPPFTGNNSHYPFATETIVPGATR
jgi:uncharacterized protein (TIGR02118 family)